MCHTKNPKLPTRTGPRRSEHEVQHRQQRTSRGSQNEGRIRRVADPREEHHFREGESLQEPGTPNRGSERASVLPKGRRLHHQESARNP